MTKAQLLAGVTGGVADRWVQTLFTPAFVFWLGGGLAAVQRYGWQPVADSLVNLPEPLLLTVAILALLVVAASGFVAQQFELAVIKLLEGYWPNWCRPVSRWCIKRQRQKFKQLDQQWQAFNKQGLATLTPEERQDYIAVDLQLSEFPDAGRLLPLRLGNILRSPRNTSTKNHWPSIKTG